MRSIKIYISIFLLISVFIFSVFFIDRADSWELVEQPEECDGDACAKHFRIEENRYVICPRSSELEVLKTDGFDILIAGRTACIFGARKLDPVPEFSLSSDLAKGTNLDRCMIATCALSLKKSNE